MRHAFSLVELLVVLAIMAILLGVGATTMRRDERDAQVRGAAEALAAVLRETRTRAIQEQSAFGVVFNIQNQPGTSGVVLNNWSGGHYYRVIGPHAQGGNNNSRALPRGTVTADDWNQMMQGNLPDVLAKISESWVSEPCVLPAKQVRFLALSDTEEGPRNTLNPANRWWGGSNVYYGDAGETTYPRPWFGYYDKIAKKWWPWGGYTPGKKYSGLYYEGAGGPVPDSKNPDSRIFNHNFRTNASVHDNMFKDVDLNGDGDTDDLREKEVGYAIWRINEPRPLVNADWLDSCIMFTPSGQAVFLEWNRNRRAFENAQATLNPLKSDGTVNQAWDAGSNTHHDRNGCRDRAKNCDVNGGAWCVTSGPVKYDKQGWVKTNVTDEVVHFERHNGGYHITLGPDAGSDGNDFPDAASVIRDITPAYRVFVGTNGSVRSYRVQRRSDAYLSGHTVWPPTPETWLQTAPSGNPIWNRCRLGWLHAVGPRWWEFSFTKTGNPVNYIVTERMLTDRIWWFDE